MNLYIIGISGKMGSGKDTAASHIKRYLPEASYEAKTYSFATEVKNFALQHFPSLVSPETLINKTPESRAVLQGVGDGIRKSISESHWVDLEYRKVLRDFEIHISSGDTRDFIAIFTDVRYVNELMSIFRYESAIKSLHPSVTVIQKALRVAGRSSDSSNSHVSEKALEFLDKSSFPNVELYNNVSTLSDYKSFLTEWIRGILV